MQHLPSTMEPCSNLRLLFISIFLVVFLNPAISRVAPDSAPTPQPEPSAISGSPQSSPSPASSQSQSDNVDHYVDTIDLPENTNSDSPSPTGSPSDSDDLDSPSPSGSPSNSHDSDLPSPAGSLSDSDDSDAPSPVGSPSPSDESESVKLGSTSESTDSVDTDSTSESSDVPTGQSSGSANPDLQNICSQTDHPDLCMETVGPLANGKSDPNAILQASLQAGSDYAKQGLSEAQKLVDQPQPDEAETVTSTLKDCKDGYGSAVENYQKAMDAMSENDVFGMRIQLSAVITFIGDCQDQLKQVDTSLNQYNQKMIDMTSNCLALA